MESKEYIEDKVKSGEKYIEKYPDCKDFIKSEVEHYKQVLKDLEILEILKLRIQVLKTDDNYYYVLWNCPIPQNVMMPITEEYYYKIKNWLEEK